MQNFIVFDTETISLTKPYSYNVGWVVANLDGILVKRDFLIKEFWYNYPLMSTAYYIEKKALYKEKIKAKEIKIVSWAEMIKVLENDIQAFEIETAYAYNSDFDERVFDFNSEYKETANPLLPLEVYDIMGYAFQHFKDNQHYKEYCLDYGHITDKGLYKLTAESVYSYITGEINYQEEHTALADSLIEYEILKYLIDNGLKINEHYEKGFMDKIKKQCIIQTENINLTTEFTSFTKKRNENVWILK